MGIAPISGLTSLPAIRPVEMELGSPVERVENSIRTGDETYSPSDGRSADESEEQLEASAPEDLPEDPPDEESSGEESAEPAAYPPSPIIEKKINFFA